MSQINARCLTCIPRIDANTLKQRGAEAEQGGAVRMRATSLWPVSSWCLSGLLRPVPASKPRRGPLGNNNNKKNLTYKNN